MLQTFSVPIGGRIVNAKANFFRYESAAASGADQTIRVRVDGQDLGEYLPGDSIRLPIEGKVWEISFLSGSQAAVVRLGVGQIESARLIGNVSITNRISAACSALFGNGILSIGGNAVQIIGPASNPRGLTIRRASCYATSGGGGGTVEARVICAPVTPTSTVPANSFQACGAYSVGGVQSTDFRNDMNYQIPPAWGIWLYTSVLTSAAAGAGYELTYETL